MAFSGGIDDLSGTDLLDCVDALALQQRRIDTELLVGAAKWAAMNSRDVVKRSGKPGRQSCRLYGGSGTPEVASFAGAELGARIGRSTHAGDSLTADALDLTHRLPQLWLRVQAGEVLASYARCVARKTRELAVDQAKYVDSRVVESADGRITWSRFEDLVEAAVKTADPEAARAREEKARQAQFAKQTRSVTDGLAGFFIQADVATIALVTTTVGFVAKVLADLGVDEPADRLRVLAVAVLMNPAQAVQLLAAYAEWKAQPTDTTPPPAEPPTSEGRPDPDPETEEPPTPAEQVMAAVLDLIKRSGWSSDGCKPTVDWGKLLPRVQLFVHVYAGELRRTGLTKLDETGLARIEGYGTVTEPWIRDMLGPLARFAVRPVLDLDGQAPVDAWEIPDRHRRAVRLMTPADVFPFSTATVNSTDGWRGMQIDHTIPYDHASRDDARGHGDDLAGQSRIGNYGPLTQFHHNLKTHGGWQCQQPFPGIYVWRDPHGAHYPVDHTGTQRVRRWASNIRLDLVEYDDSAA